MGRLHSDDVAREEGPALRRTYSRYLLDCREPECYRPPKPIRSLSEGMARLGEEREIWDEWERQGSRGPPPSVPEPSWKRLARYTDAEDEQVTNG